MRHLAGTAFAVLLALPFGAGSARAMNEDAVPMVLEKAVDGFIRPGYHAFEAATGTMASAMAAFCAAPDEATYGDAITAYDQLVTAWSHIEIVRTGPVIDDHRFERILFYPDRKSIGLKQVQAAIIEQDETATDPAYLPEKALPCRDCWRSNSCCSGRNTRRCSMSRRPIAAVTVRRLPKMSTLSQVNSPPNGMRLMVLLPTGKARTRQSAVSHQ
nr:imelysin family protein [Marinicella sp. W31]MDC2877843.1 imelysin family protein [Marinicella sp. W31]